jgi:3-hydroxybutyrate dehydrogenase
MVDEISEDGQSDYPGGAAALKLLISEPEIKRDEILIVQDADFSDGHVCIVTGAGGGIGRATAVAAAANGLLVVGLDVNAEEGERTQSLARAMGGEMVFIEADLAVDEDIDRAVAAAASYGHIKYLANIAGIQHVSPIEEFPMEVYDHMMRLMLRAPFYLSKLTIPHMRRSPGATGVIGSMSSVHAHICTVNKAVYNMTKFGVRALTQSLAAEGAGSIRAFTVSTGFVKTNLAVRQIPAQAEQRGISEDQVVSEVMMGSSRVKEMMTPIEAANLFVFGFSRFARYLDGGDLLFDGGMVLTYAEKKDAGLPT